MYLAEQVMRYVFDHKIFVWRRASPFLILWIWLLSPLSAMAAPILVDGAWLERHLNDEAVVVVDMSSDGMQYQRFHLPAAVRLPYSALVQRNRRGVTLRIPDERLYKILGMLGISSASHVVVYDDMGGLEAGRLFWELERIGHANVSVLDGGLVKWILEGRKVVSTPVKPRPTTYKPAAKGRRDNEISGDGVERISLDGGALLLDVRSQEEYQGNPRMPRSGHIPSARWWPWDETVAFDRGFSIKNQKVLNQSLDDVGAADHDAPVVVYCHTGHRAAQAYLVLRYLGYGKVRLYDGSMAEYVQRKDAALAKGMRP